MITKKQIKQSQNKLKKQADSLDEMNQLYFAVSDSTRLKIIVTLADYDELCVSDLAAILDMSISAVSHQLSFLERAGIVNHVRKGKMVCHSLADKKIIKNLCL